MARRAPPGRRPTDEPGDPAADLRRLRAGGPFHARAARRLLAGAPGGLRVRDRGVPGALREPAPPDRRPARLGRHRAGRRAVSAGAGRRVALPDPGRPPAVRAVQRRLPQPAAARERRGARRHPGQPAGVGPVSAAAGRRARAGAPLLAAQRSVLPLEVQPPSRSLARANIAPHAGILAFELAGRPFRPGVRGGDARRLPQCSTRGSWSGPTACGATASRRGAAGSSRGPCGP